MGNIRHKRKFIFCWKAPASGSVYESWWYS